MTSFEYTDDDGGRFAAKPLPGVPYILLMTDIPGSAIPVNRLEEVIAGLRDIARQAAGQAEPPRPTVVIHEKPAAETPIIVVRPGTEG